MNDPPSTALGIQVKICGLTRPQEALECTTLGADAIGLVFYRKSPRYVSLAEAKAISSALPPGTRLVGVFVNHEFDAVMERVEGSGLWGAQLHGQESPETVARLKDAGVAVIKTLFRSGSPALSTADDYDPTAFLIESGIGPLPGGNARSWDWSDARFVSDRYPVLLAGGLSELNVIRAAEGARADAVDVSSGVESRPGRKDMDRVVAFMESVARFKPAYEPRRIF